MAKNLVGLSRLCFVCLTVFFAAATALAPAKAADVEKRLALVIGNGSYAAKPLPTAANDAGLIAQTLQAAGFDVVGARDLDQASLRQSLHDFREKVQQSGPNTVALVYLNGYALQFEGANYFLPVDANLHAASDLPTEAIRISDYTKSIAALSPKAEILVVDAARTNPYSLTGDPLAGGLALEEALPGTLVAFNASPGTVGPPETGAYGTYAHALADAMRQGGLSLAETFEQANLRVNQLTHGAEVPWDDAKVSANFEFFTLTADASAPKASREKLNTMANQPIRSFTAADAYAAAIMRGTMEGYLDFIAAYPDDPMAPRVRAIVAARREAIVWHRTWLADTPEAYWSYLRRYPKGPHVWDARRRLHELAAEFDPPPSFVEIDYGLPPPMPYEITIVERPFIFFGDFGYPPPPPPPEYFLPPLFAVFYDLPPPPPPPYAYILPVPVYIPVPIWVEHPVYLVPPPAGPNIYFQNFHNTVAVNQSLATVSITPPQGTPVVSPALQQQGLPGPAGANHLPLLAPALPTSLAKHIQQLGGLPALKNNPALVGKGPGGAPLNAIVPNAGTQNVLPKQNQLPGFVPGNAAKGILPPPAGTQPPPSTPLMKNKLPNNPPVLPLPGAQGTNPVPPTPNNKLIIPGKGKLNPAKPPVPLDLQQGKTLGSPPPPPPPPVFKPLKKLNNPPPGQPLPGPAPSFQPDLHRKPNGKFVLPGAGQNGGPPPQGAGGGKPGAKGGPNHGCKPGEVFVGGKCVGP
ncbi:MAG: caspase family protein [Alphaproteobacteria bacterium]|nr:caspase family protein [Alphaproteobacteria bacterium]